MNWAEVLYRPKERRVAVGDWVATVAGYRDSTAGFQDARGTVRSLSNLDLLAAVERTEQPAGLVRQVAPGFVWWELKPGADLREKHPIYVWREYGHPAPVWRVRRLDWFTGLQLPTSSIPLSGWGRAATRARGASSGA